MRLAMNLVREEHGDDAVILSTKDVENGVEIVAALDPEAMQFQEQQENVHSIAGSSFQSPETFKASSVASTSVDNQELTKMAAEIQAVKALLENQLSGLAWGHEEQHEPHKVALIKRLLQLGIGWDLSQKLVQKVDANDDRAWSAILANIE